MIFLNKYKWFLLLFVSYILILIYFNRSTFSDTFDSTYWQNRYETSQWRLFKSKRILGDSGLYEIQGYNLFKGEDPSLHNPENPPLAKYIIGFFITYFGNSSFYGLFVMSLSFISLFILLNLLTSSVIVSVLGSLLVFVDPLIVMQFTAPMMDMLQLLFILIVGVILLVMQKMKRSHFDSVLLFCLGATTGLFSLTKFPLFLIPLCIEILFLIKNIWKHMSRKIFNLILFAAGFVGSYALVYMRYFMLGHTVIDWLKLQKWMINFFWISKLHGNIGSNISILFANTYKDLFTGVWVRAETWSFMWPIVFIGFCIHCLLFLRNYKHNYVPYLFFAASILGIYFFLPFWTRYLTILLPLLYIQLFILLKKFLQDTQIKILLLVCIGINIFFSAQVLIPHPKDSITQFTRDWKYGFFMDMYERVDPGTIQLISRDTFNRMGQRFWYDAQIEEADIAIKNIHWVFPSSTASAHLEITYKTKFLGTFTQVTDIQLVLKDNRWNILWDWGNFISGLSQDSTIKSSVIYGRRGSLYKGEILMAEDIPSFLISIIPNKIDLSRENELLTLLAKILKNKVDWAAIHTRYVENTQPNWPIAIGTIPFPLYDDKVASLTSQLRDYPGISIEEGKTRYPSILNEDVKNTVYAECCSLLYSPYSYHGIVGYEKQFDKELSGADGGSIVIESQKGDVTRVIKDIAPIHGNDSVIPYGQ